MGVGTPIQKLFGATVRKLRLQGGMSQEALAARASLKRTYLSDLERGHRNVSLATLERVADALNVHPSLLLAQFPVETDLPSQERTRLASKVSGVALASGER